ncbi:MAG: TetR/AcrR family transcriptional regulator [Eubacteriales bacterium]
MPAAKRFSKDEIIDAAVEVLRDGGFSSVNARSVAKKLGCSTQPIYFSFANMDELKAALTERAVLMHTRRVRDSLRAHEGNDSRYSSYGMGFVKFAAEEKQLFRWLYLEGRQSGPYSADVLYSEIIGVVVDEFGYSEEVARRFHRDMLYFTYGLAILANTDHLNLTEYELREAFRREFRALTAIYGKPSKLPDFAVKEGIVLSISAFHFRGWGSPVFALPMLINIAYVIFPPVGAANEPAAIPRPLEITERVSRIVYLIAVTFLVSGEPVSRRSAALYIAACFLDPVLCRVDTLFHGGRNVALLGEAFLLVIAAGGVCRCFIFCSRPSGCATSPQRSRLLSSARRTLPCRFVSSADLRRKNAAVRCSAVEYDLNDEKIL